MQLTTEILIRERANGMVCGYRGLLNEIAPGLRIPRKMRHRVEEAVADLLCRDESEEAINLLFSGLHATHANEVSLVISEAVRRAEARVEEIERSWKVLNADPRMMKAMLHMASLRWLEDRVEHESSGRFEVVMTEFVTNGDAETMDFILDHYEQDLMTGL